MPSSQTKQIEIGQTRIRNLFGMTANTSMLFYVPSKFCWGMYTLQAMRDLIKSRNVYLRNLENNRKNVREGFETNSKACFLPIRHLEIRESFGRVWISISLRPPEHAHWTKHEQPTVLSDGMLRELFGNKPTIKRITSIQVRIYGPRLGVVKGMLRRKPGIQRIYVKL